MKKRTSKWISSTLWYNVKNWPVLQVLVIEKTALVERIVRLDFPNSHRKLKK
jgi:hypothetical protein